MKAMAISGFDTEPTLHDLPAPEPGDGQVVVDVEWASVNGMDLAVRFGMVKGMMPYELPITLGRDFAGTVAAVGTGVSELAIGDPVIGVESLIPLHHGSFAEQILVPASSVGKRPEHLDPQTAGALPLAGTAARTSITALSPTAGETILVVGATGGVGSLAIQMAKRCGATVIATATPDDAAFVRDLGADETVDYTDDVAAAVRAHRPSGVDVVLHLAGDGLAAADLVRPGGRFASVLGLGSQQMGDRELTATAIMSIPTPGSLGELAASVAAGELRVPISKTYTLDEVPKALQEFTTGKRGKISVRVR